MVRPHIRDDKPRALSSGDPSYTRTNHILTCTFSTLHLMHLLVSDVVPLKGAISANTFLLKTLTSFLT